MKVYHIPDVQLYLQLRLLQNLELLPYTADKIVTFQNPSNLKYLIKIDLTGSLTIDERRVDF
jgi:hypothetical protein